MRIAVIGATGWLGGTIAREAASRGHEVTAIARHLDDGVRADVTDRKSVLNAVRGHDVVVSAVTDRTSEESRSIIPATAKLLLDVLPEAGVPRLAFVGGGGSLETEPGVRHVDSPHFPPEYKAEALAQARALDILRASHGVDWTYLSPPPVYFDAGEKTGTYRVAGGDAPVVDAQGESRINSGDFAAALVDELESPQFSRTRFTAAY
jgi:putative NADH-flavin reductase